MRCHSELCVLYLEKCVPWSVLLQEPREGQSGLSSEGAGSVVGCCELCAGGCHRVFTASPGAVLEADRETHCEKKPSTGLGILGEKRAHNSCCKISALKKVSPSTSLVAQTAKRLPPMQETQVQFLGREDPLEKEMATHSSTLAWKIP